MNAVIGTVGGLVIGAALGWGVATKMPGMLGNAGGSNTSTGGALFSLDGKTYAEADMPSELKSALFEGQHESYERTVGLVTQYGMRLALAKDQNKASDPNNLPPFEDLLGIPPASEQEVQSLFEANKARLPAGTTYEQVKPDIERYMTQQKMSEALRAKNQEFKASNRLKILMPEPMAPKVDIDVAAFPSRGPASASHTLVEASDYLCPHCQTMAPEVDATVKEMGDKIRFVQVNFSLKPDGLSGALARGGYCAQQQGNDQFWKYHEKAFETAKAKGWKQTDPDAKEPVIEVATAAGIDTAKIDACLGTPEAVAFVKKSIDTMNAAGLTGTPTFFLNGRKLSMHGTSLKETLTGAMSGSSH